MIARARLYFGLILAVVLDGCAAVGPPLPPELHLPLPVSDLTAVQRGPKIIVQFTMPVATTEGMPIEDTPLTEVYVGSSATVFDQAAWQAGAARYTDTTGKGKLEILVKPFIGKDVVMALRLKNGNGHDAGWSNFVTLPITAIVSRPENLKPKADALGVKLTWTGSAPLYRIYRKDNTASDFAPMGDTSATSYIDATAEYGKPYQYFVQGLQKSGDKMSESDVSDTVPITAKDEFAPAVPTNLQPIVGTKTIELSWSRNTEPDLAGYRLYRAEGDGPLRLIAAALSSPSYSDHDVKSGVRHRYRVLAFDQAGNTSDQSQPVEAQVP